MSRIAVIGSGISGMAAAYLLSRKHEVHLLEREERLGGHTHTHTIPTSRGVVADRHRFYCPQRSHLSQPGEVCFAS